MAQTKFVVLTLKDILKKGIIAIIGIIILIALLISFLPKSQSNEELSYIPGEYIKEVVLENIAPFYVNVVVSEDTIEDIYISELADNYALFYPLIETTFETVKSQVLKTQGTTISVEPEILVTSTVLVKAIEDALYDSATSSTK
ncbi:MAG: hypothetical protein ACK5LY_08535 [Lachnospirales bacterium]